MYKDKKIIVVAPCNNEEAKIGDVVLRIKRMAPRIVDEILVVDDGSTDRSVAVVQEIGATVIEMQTRHGVGAVFRRGIQYAVENKYDICVCIAGNNKDEPEEIPRLLDPIIEQDYDIVQGSRFIPGGKTGNMPMYRHFATRLHPLLFSIFLKKRITESTNGFRAFKTSIISEGRINLNQSWLDAYELEPYVLFKAIQLGYRHTEVPVTKIYPPKELGYTKMKPITGWWSILRPVFYLGLGIKK